MNEWVPPSLATQRLTIACSAVWGVAVVCAVLAKTSPGGLSAVALALAVGLDVFSAGWILHSLRRIPLARKRPGVWESMGYGFAVAAIAPLVLVWVLLQYHEVQPGLLESLVMALVSAPPGIAVAAASRRMQRSSLAPSALRNATLTSITAVAFFMFVAVGPGMGMPFSITKRDIVTLVGIATVVFLLLGPSIYCTQATLALPVPQRARPWVWFTASAVVMLMALSIYPLIYPHQGGTYPIMVLSLAGSIAAGGLSLAADIESALPDEDPSASE